jgi:hypothetical protein
MKRILWVTAALLTAPAGAVEHLDFGGWCAQIARYPQERCIAGLAEDKLAYGRYLEAINSYENEYIKKQDARRIETERVNRMGDVTADQAPTEGAADPR